MSFAGVVLASWLALAALAFMGLTALTRLAARGDRDAELGIVGEAELRDEPHLPLEVRLAYLGIPAPRGGSVR